MGIVNLLVDLSQSARLDTHDEEIEKLKKDMETARVWIEFLNKQLEEMRNAKSNIDGTGTPLLHDQSS